MSGASFIEGLERRALLSSTLMAPLEMGETSAAAQEMSLESGKSTSPDPDTLQQGPGDTAAGGPDVQGVDAGSDSTTAGTTASPFKASKVGATPSVVGTFSGAVTIKRAAVTVTITILSQGADGSVSGTFSSSAFPAASPLTGTIKGRHFTATYPDGGRSFTVKGTVSKDGRSLVGTLKSASGSPSIRGRLVAMR